MALKVLIVQDIVQEGKDYLLERGYEIQVASSSDVETVKREIQGCDGALVRIAPFPGEIMETADRLRVVGRHGIGVDNIDLETATRLGIQICNAPGANSNAVAEHTAAALLALVKKLMPCDNALRSGNWEYRSKVRIGDVEDMTIGLLGLGLIGRLVAQKLHFGFGAKILGYDPYARDIPDYIEPCDPERLYRESDCVSLHLPALPETRGMINRAVFEKMKPTAFFLNMARGSIVVDEDLAWALHNGVIAGASLDAFDPEPIAADNPLLQAPNLIMTPHTAALSVKSNILMATRAAQGIHEVLSGQTPTWPVNRLRTRA